MNALVTSDPSIFDQWRPIAIALYLAFMSYAVLVGIPVISSAWMEYLHFSEVEVGHLASADLGGMSLGAFLISFIVAKFNRRWLVLFGITVVITMNFLSAYSTDFTSIFILRMCSGMGCGFCAAIALATLSATSHPVKAYNKLLLIFTIFQVPEMYFLHKLSIAGIYFLIIGCFVVAIPFIRWFPKYAIAKPLQVDIDIEDHGQQHHFHQRIPHYAPWFCLLAIFFTYVNIGAYWTYVEIAGFASGISKHWMSQVLIYGTLCSIVSCLVATKLGRRFGLATPLLISLCLMSMVVGMLSLGIGQWNILLSVFMFNALWIFIDVFQMATISNMDHAGGYASLMPCAQGLGQIVGPSFAATLLGWGFGYSSVFMLGAVAALLGMVTYAIMHSRLTSAVKLITDAS